MRRVVFDANVWGPAVAFPGSVPDQVIELARENKIPSVICETIIQQVRRALLSERFAVPHEVVAEIEAEIRRVSESDFLRSCRL